MKETTFIFHNRLSDIDDTVLSIKSAAKDVLSFDALTRFEICLSESLTNLVLHGHRKHAQGPSEIRLGTSPDGVELVLLDPVGSAAFDPRPHVRELVDVAPDAEGGRGLGLIWQCADSVDYQFENERNQLTFKIENRPKESEQK